MAFLRFLFWTSFCIAFGVFLARYQVNGQTPLGHLERWAGQEPEMRQQLDKVKSGVNGAIDGARSAVQKPPQEQHSPDDRKQVEKIIAGRRPK